MFLSHHQVGIDSGESGNDPSFVGFSWDLGFPLLLLGWSRGGGAKLGQQFVG